jgi:hypothetical protein
LHPGAASLPRFTLFGWVSPPADSTTLARYTELAGAGFNVTVLAWEDPGSVPPNLLRLEYSAQVGVRNLLLDNRLDHVHERRPCHVRHARQRRRSLPRPRAFLGYYLGDEPKETLFPRIAEWFRLLRSRDPAHPGWNNLSGRGVFRHAMPSSLICARTRARCSRRCCPPITTTIARTENRDCSWTTSRATAQVAREYGLPFWGILLVTQHGTFREVDDGLLSWQVAQWLSYGARVSGYFTYWTPAPDPAMNWRDGMIRYGTGERSSHYEQVRVLNQLVKPVGESLAELAWLGTEHAGGTPVGGTTFMPDSLVAAVEGACLARPVRGRTGKPHLFVANRDSAAARTIALELVGERRVERMGEGGAWCGVDVSAHRDRPARGAAARSRRVRAAAALGRLRRGGERRLHRRFSASPEPARHAVRFAAERVAGSSTLMMVDASGRRVWGCTLAGEAPVVVWDGRADDGTRVRPGLYWARLEDSRGSVVRKVTWLGR